MREFYTKKNGEVRDKAFALLMLLCGFCLWAKAADDIPEKNLGVLELGKTYTIDANSVAYGIFTPTESGWLRVDATSANCLYPYKKWLGNYDETVINATDNALSFTTISTGSKKQSCYEIQVEAGVTYCLAGKVYGLVETGTDCVLSMDKKRELIYYGPNTAEGAVVSPTRTSQLSFNFNRTTKYASAELSANGHTIGLSGRNATNYISLSIKDALIEMSTKGWIVTGDKFTVTIKGIRTEAGDLTYDKDVVATYELGALPAALVSSFHTEGSILTWYEPGDPEGLISLEFSKKIKSASAIINYGISGRGVEDNQFVRIPITPIIDGNKVVIDLTGVRRLPTDMITADGVDFSQDGFKKITIGITGIRDEDGVSAYPSSKWMTFDLVTPQTDIACDFTPADGSNIDNVDAITIWIQDESKLKYSGVDFSYNGENGEKKTVTVTELKKEKDSATDNAVYVTVDIPTEVKGKGNVVVSLHDLSCVDGKDYTSDILAEYTTTISTGIQQVDLSSHTPTAIYNINGMKLENTKSLKGVFIVNGKKIVK